MGQKIHPTGFRLSVTRNWGSRWYAGNSNFATMLNEDLDVRAYLKKKLKNASVGRIVIERPAKNARITIQLPAGSCNRQERRGHRSSEVRPDQAHGRARSRQYRRNSQAGS
jgi:hypothetical protein